MAVRPLIDRPPFGREPPIVVARPSCRVGAQGLVALGHVLGFVLAQVAEGRRQAEFGVLAGRAGEMSERALRPSASAVKLSPPSTTRAWAKPRPGQTRSGRASIQRLAATVTDGEVREAARPARCFVGRSSRSGPCSARQARIRRSSRWPDAGVQFRVPLLEHADRADAWTVLQDRHHLGLEDIGQRVRSAPCPVVRRIGREGTDPRRAISRGRLKARLRRLCGSSASSR